MGLLFGSTTIEEKVKEILTKCCDKERRIKRKD